MVTTAKGYLGFHVKDCIWTAWFFPEHTMFSLERELADDSVQGRMSTPTNETNITKLLKFKARADHSVHFPS